MLNTRWEFFFINPLAAYSWTVHLSVSPGILMSQQFTTRHLSYLESKKPVGTMKVLW